MSTELNPSKPSPVIVVQGGAGAYMLVEQDKIARSVIEDGVIVAATEGYKILSNGGLAVEAVEAAAVSMENNPIFNCGYGSFLTSDRSIEMDASIMNGNDLSTGAVACITNVKNPILVARAVMDKTQHTMFCGQAATNLAISCGFDRVTTESLTTKKALNRLQISPGYDRVKPSWRHPDEHDTVGAVALDVDGNVAYATTTGGISGKMVGRVGDSAVVGSGGYADNDSGAVSTTGDGEAFVKMCTAKQVAMLIEQGEHPQVAIEIALAKLQSRLSSSGGGGCVALNPQGDIGVHFNTKGMAWAAIKDGNVQYGIYKDEKYTKVYSD